MGSSQTHKEQIAKEYLVDKRMVLILKRTQILVQNTLYVDNAGICGIFGCRKEHSAIMFYNQLNFQATLERLGKLLMYFGNKENFANYYLNIFSDAFMCCSSSFSCLLFGCKQSFL